MLGTSDNPSRVIENLRKRVITNEQKKGVETDKIQVPTKPHVLQSSRTENEVK